MLEQIVMKFVGLKIDDGGDTRWSFDGTRYFETCKKLTKLSSSCVMIRTC